MVKNPYIEVEFLPNELTFGWVELVWVLWIWKEVSNQAFDYDQISKIKHRVRKIFDNYQP